MPHAKHSAMNGFPNRKSQAVIERQSTVIALQRKISEQMALLTAMAAPSNTAAMSKRAI